MDISIHYREGDEVQAECLPRDQYGPESRLIKIDQRGCRNHVVLFLDTEFATKLRTALDELYPVVGGKVTPFVPPNPDAATDAYADEHAAEFGQQAPPPRKPEHSMDDPSQPSLASEVFDLVTTMNTSIASTLRGAP